MNPVHDLFEKYSQGNLDDAGIELLHRHLLEAYFDSPGDLDREELEYSEDLAIESHIRNQLDSSHAPRFRAKLSEDPALEKKHSLHKTLMGSARNSREKRVHRLASSGSSDEQEEEQLREILQEVIRKAEAEKEVALGMAWVQNFRFRLTGFMEGAGLWIGLHRAQVKLVLVIASVALVIGFSWMLFWPGGENLMVETAPKQPLQPNQSEVSEPVHETGATVIIKEEAAEKIKKMIISMFEPEKSFTNSPLRGEETTPAGDAFILAADQYNLQQYDTCIRILKELTDKKAFRDRDSISQIYYYLGNCYLIKGMKQNNAKLINLSLQSFDSIDRQSYYFKPAWWCRVFAFAKIGSPETSAKYLDSLVIGKYGRYGKVKALRDSIQRVNASK
jgi:hypothetical protein